MAKKKQVIVSFKTKPIIFDVEPSSVNDYLFGKKRKKEVKRK